MRKGSLLLILLVLCFALNSKAQLIEGKKNIEKLCGCFDVEFKYAETFSPDRNYKFHEREDNSAALELAIPIENSERKISIQHLLVVSGGMIVKHWREDWVFEPTQIWEYTGDLRWVKKNVSPEQVKGKWMQTVWEVSDAPRYQGFSEWVKTDGKLFWLNTTDAPLPRREYTTRNDYNILRRTNKLLITDSGWIHEQDNQKINRSNGFKKLIAEEKGFNTYKRLDDKYCEAAKGWWTKNQEYWSKVRIAWDEYLQTDDEISINATVNGLVLHELLNKLNKDYIDQRLEKKTINVEIRKGLESFVAGKHP